MFSRFTEKAIQAIMLAQEEAKRFHHSYVGTEHILLGVIGEGDNIVIKALKDLGFSIEQVKSAIEDHLEYGGISSEYGNIPFTQQAKQVLTHAWDEARKLGHNYVNVEHLFLSVFRDPSNIAARVLSELGITINNFKEALFSQLGNKVNSQTKTYSDIPTPTLDLYGRDLTFLAKDGKLDPVVGREKEIERIIQILCRRTKNNPVLTGDPGVGKTAIVEGLAQRIHKENVPEKLCHKRVVTLDLGLLVAGTKYRGEFEDRVKKVMEEARKSGNIILFIDELHTIIGTGGSEGSLDAANLFKPALARGELQCIGATTLEEYRKHIEGDGALERRFQSVLVEEPSPEDTLLILKGIRSRYEDFHGVKITDAALKEAVELSNRYINDRRLPDKAVDVIDEAASKVMLAESRLSEESRAIHQDLHLLLEEKKEISKKENLSALKNIKEKEKELREKMKGFPKVDSDILNKTVSSQIIAEVVSAWTGIPVTKLNKEEMQRLLKMEEEIKKHVVGQDEAVKALVRAVKRSKIGLKDPRRPSGSFLFLGPTGVGKTELAKTLAEFLFGSKDSMIRIDMSEFMEKHTVSRLIGSPPGYVGYNEGGQLTEPIRRKPYSVVLFDELEKASSDVINILLQILEDGRLTDSTGRHVSFKNALIIMTSNVGSKYIQQETSFGFVEASKEAGNKYDAIKRKLDDELKREFRPEFLNRIDDIVIFKTLTKDNTKEILDILLKQVMDRLTVKGIHLSWDEDVKNFLVEKGFDQKMGARPLRRSIQEHLEDPLADYLLENNMKSDIDVTVFLSQSKLTFEVKKKVKKTSFKEIQQLNVLTSS